jgi:hypothetical protein
MKEKEGIASTESPCRLTVILSLDDNARLRKQVRFLLLLIAFNALECVYSFIVEVHSVTNAFAFRIPKQQQFSRLVTKLDDNNHISYKNVVQLQAKNQEGRPRPSQRRQELLTYPISYIQK